MITSLLGVLVLIGVMAASLVEPTSVKISFLDVHAALVVFGGVLGSLLIAMDGKSLRRMWGTLYDLLPWFNRSTKEIRLIMHGIDEIKSAWRGSKRALLLEMAEKGQTEEIRVAADALVRRMSGPALTEAFTILRTNYVHSYLPVIEGWEMISRLAPSFGMVGTITGMVQLFRNMGQNSGNLGGAMAMALLATLYGIAFGAAVGGSMASRTNKEFNDHLAALDLVEKTVASLISENEIEATAS